MQIAALYVETNGAYFGLPGVDPWDVTRDARTYVGPLPVVAHPPCSRWCVPLAYVNQTRYGHRVGDDGGMFAHALRSVDQFGGVLEHPAYTVAWAAHGLLKPTKGQWTRTDHGGWVCQVAQSAYGHRARKRTWLYYRGIAPPTSMLWAEPPASALVSQLKHTKSTLPRMRPKEAKATPIAFRDALISLARGSAAELRC